MSREQDVLKVFNFLIELLQEPTTNQPTTEPQPETKDVEPETKVLGVPSSDISDLIRRVDEFDKRRPSFDEPFLRKSIPQELRDEEGVVTGITFTNTFTNTIN